MNTSEPSVFTRIINRELPATIHYEDDEMIVIESNQPKAPVHLLGIPKKPIATMHELLQSEENKELLWKLYRTLSDMAAKLGIDTSGYKLTVNVGEDGGQSVYHVHIHLLGGAKLQE